MKKPTEKAKAFGKENYDDFEKFKEEFRQAIKEFRQAIKERSERNEKLH